ncbi:glycosyltransferase family 4 protein [Qipengyuania gelatinilytica]|uniref:Glycosyltransferase family 4 protein n=1 Tax=Qipengyuania gelatinilytica TaxID=2867231 RepID=A0ABX9A243_9SPHN|nr:glycosyltransferase family 4 protein [Qipengyuania gelatinilytica]QZD93907.1 glycosyltransferase family 4 protein [Qipengyuania gelatinilytica]
MQVAVFHPGTQHSRQTALALQQLGRLAFLATGLFDHPSSRMRSLARALPSALSAPLETELSRFAAKGLDPAKVRAMARYELPERIAARLGAGDLATRLDAALNATFGRKVAAMAGREGPFVLWGYDGSSATAFNDPRAAGCYKILDRTMADSRSWNEERERIAATHGDWLGKGSPAWSADKIAMDDAEFAAADRIVCGSPFVMDTIRAYSPVGGVADKLELLPYGFDAALFGSDVDPAFVPEAEPVRFLFAGQVAARKGVQHVLEAFGKLPKGSARLTLLGQLGLPEPILARYRDRVDILGAVPRAEVPAIMREHHALVFPSHNEGSAIVLPEAMASGLAIIQTAAAGLGASANSGFVLDRPNAGGVEEAMAKLIANRELLHSMRLAAIAEARQRNSDAYRDAIAALLEKLGL